jgi:hypothetical protein
MHSKDFYELSFDIDGQAFFKFLIRFSYVEETFDLNIGIEREQKP